MSRRKPRQRVAELAFDALAIEGGLLSPEWLARAAQLQAGGQAEADYRVPKGLNLRDEIGRYWRIAQANWRDFQAGRAGGADLHAVAERFVQALLRESFGFESLAPVAPLVIAERSYPIGFSALGDRVPVVIGTPTAGTATEKDRSGLDDARPELGDVGRRRSAFGLAQEYLNAADPALWGIASDGISLRILRDNASLTRPAWVEANLERIFTEERYPDFAALWLLLHETRFGKPGQPVTECALEDWRTAGREEGTRAREHLRRGVEDALIALGQGFLAQRDNHALRKALQDGSLSTKDYFAQLLRMVYRLIFLLTVEERGLLHPDRTDEKAKKLFADGYSLKRLRERSVKRSAHDRFSDLWEALKIVIRGLAGGEPRLGLPALAGIFDPDQCAALDAAKLENRALLQAVFLLSWLREDGALVRVNWRDMGPEELGSVYESLLELVPQVTLERRVFAFATGGETKGNARKTTGSYYTPDSLVQVLLDSALEPVIAETIAKNPEKPVDALLALSIVDPACGSGHFLLAAARRLAAHVARLQANGTPSAAEYRHALRQVVGHSIYGVDLNPMAVELCKVSLWMEAVEPGLPLTFLDSHIQHGNALLGATPELIAQGVPDAAWELIEGDDKKVASALKKRNKAERTSPNLSFEFSNVAEGATVAILSSVQALDAAPDGQVGEVMRKGQTWRQLLASEQFRGRRLAADAWCAAFVWQKQVGELAEVAPTHAEWEGLRHAPEKASSKLVAEVERLAGQYRFFHWHLAFPQVFARGGFDVVLGNPPWERVKLQEQEFFASQSDEIASAPNAAARKKIIAALPETNSLLWKDWCEASRKAEGESQFIRRAGRYPLCGKGDVNTYAIFAEHNRLVLSPHGRAGFIVPTGIATDDTTKEFFADLMTRKNLAAFYGFENEAKLFKGIDHRVNFCLLVLSSPEVLAPSFSAFIREPSVLRDSARVYQLTAGDIALLNPNTKTCPVFRCRRDAEINLGIYARVGVLWREGDPDCNPWDMRFMAMFHMANDSDLFRTRAGLEAASWKREDNQYVLDRTHMLPLIEAKMVYSLNHRSGDFALLGHREREHILPQTPDDKLAQAEYLTLPRYWVSSDEVASRLQHVWSRRWLLGWRDVTDARSSVRTLVASLIPRAATADTFLLALPDAEPKSIACLYANLCSFCLDYAARQKIGGVHLKYHVFKQLPVLPPGAQAVECPWELGTNVGAWLLPRALELTYTAWDLEPFARDVGYDGPPFRWDPARRFLLRAELDAAFFHLYSITHDDADYILDTFPIVRKNDEKVHGEYRTKRVILEVYDSMVRAIGTGKPYQTLLDPPPADPLVAHPLRADSAGATAAAPNAMGLEPVRVPDHRRG